MIQFRLDYVSDSVCYECQDTIRGIGYYDNEWNNYCQMCGVAIEHFQLITESRY